MRGTNGADYFFFLGGGADVLRLTACCCNFMPFINTTSNQSRPNDLISRRPALIRKHHQSNDVCNIFSRNQQCAGLMDAFRYAYGSIYTRVFRKVPRLTLLITRRTSYFATFQHSLLQPKCTWPSVSAKLGFHCRTIVDLALLASILSCR